MRRLLATTAAALLLTAALGCHHTAGMCDCTYGWDGCCNGGTYPGMQPPEMQSDVMKPEPLKVMPKAGDPIGK